jgi:gluconate 2-dehydrogenase gamma chain
LNPEKFRPGRRDFVLQTMSFLPLALGGAELLLSARAAQAAGDYTPVFFTGAEWQFLNAMVDRLIPADDVGPGAVQAGVAIFIDKQMDTPYGHGKLWYMQPPFHAAPPELGYQLPFVPRDLYRQGIAGADRAIAGKYGKGLASLEVEQRDAALHDLEKPGVLQTGDVPGNVFFGAVLQNTHEGYFSDPVYGGNNNMDAWRMIGFPGARADYTDWVDQYGVAYPYPPASIQGEGT